MCQFYRNRTRKYIRSDELKSLSNVPLRGRLLKDIAILTGSCSNIVIREKKGRKCGRPTVMIRRRK